MSALVIMDTETTGLSPDDDIWEFAAIRREEDGTETSHHLFLRHDTRKCARLPASFLADHRRRFPQSDTPDWHANTATPAEAAAAISRLFHDRPHVVGAVPNFDTERIAFLLREHGYEPGWHYHLIDVENLAVGWLSALRAVAAIKGLPPPAAVDATRLPWDSDELSLSCGVEPPGEGERHTAMGDVRWAMRLYDAITSGTPGGPR